MRKNDSVSSEIWNCDQALAFRCPQQWRALKMTESPDVRRCETCGKDVHRCTSPEEFLRNAERGRCVAVPEALTPGKARQLVLGMPSPAEVRRMKREEAASQAFWERVLAEEDVPIPEEIQRFITAGPFSKPADK